MHAWVTMTMLHRYMIQLQLQYQGMYLLFMLIANGSMTSYPLLCCIYYTNQCIHLAVAASSY